MTRKTKMHELRDYIIIGLAMIEGSIGLNLFLLPNAGDLAFLPRSLIWRSTYFCC